MSKYKFEPDYVVAPGETLKESIDAQGISQVQLAQRTGLAEKTISQIINGIAPITHDTARKLELVTGVSAKFWNRRELTYREALSQQKELADLAKHKAWLKEIPLDELIARKYVKPSDDVGTLVRRVLRFFGVSSVDAWREALLTPSVQYRSNKAKAKHPGYVAAWLRMGELHAETIECASFSGDAFRRLLQHEIRELTTTSLGVWHKKLPELCRQVGVAAVLTREIPQAAVGGAARWLPKRDTALIQFSLKFKTDDHVWFSFYHEAGHVLLHGKRKLFLDYRVDIKTKEEEEAEANAFARDLLIPPEHTAELARLRTKAAIRRFAARIGVSPGIVVGRLQHDDLMPPSHCNDLKKKYFWK
ncbi:MAG: ImmA/IrrE family metallo-endopeptidase [Planctomycetota bacterium]|jgi:addiction module HigA family antidote